jgi:two-component system CheB/CheR fusion protein
VNDSESAAGGGSSGHNARKSQSEVKKQAATAHQLEDALHELGVYKVELEVQHEELLAGRALLEESHARYFRLFDLVPVGLIRLSRRATILEVNVLGARMLGLDRTQLGPGERPFLVHVASESMTAFQQHFERAFASKKMETCELTLRAPGETKIFVRLQSIRSPAEKAADLFVTITDLTERRLIEEELEAQKIVADNAKRAKDQFLAMLSHELRTPLTPVLAVIDELESMRSHTEEERSVFAMMRRNLELESQLIDDLLELTRVNTGKLQLSRKVMDVHRCLINAIEICRREIAEKKLRIESDLHSLRHFAYADDMRLHQVFWNILKNAIHFSGPGDCITVKSRGGVGSRLVIEVRDTGSGIEPSALERIFDPFVQENFSGRRRPAGLGLGLAIARLIVEAHDGSVTAESAGLGQGATFRIELPAVAPPRTKAPGGTVAPPAPALRSEGMRILLIEDHDDTRNVLRRLLQGHGFEVATVANAKEAKTRCVKQKFDLILSDLGLPDAGGCELFKELHQRHGIPGIAISGFGADGDLQETKAAGFSAHLVKPLNVKDLREAIRNVLHR